MTSESLHSTDLKTFTDLVNKPPGWHCLVWQACQTSLGATSSVWCTKLHQRLSLHASGSDSLADSSIPQDAATDSSPEGQSQSHRVVLLLC